MRELFIEEGQPRRIGVRKDGQLEGLWMEENRGELLPGDLFLGIVRKKVPALSAVFVDIGAKKDGFLHVADRSRLMDYQEGQSLLVELLKLEEARKGPKLTERISMGGRFVVLFPGKGLQFSKKLHAERFIEAMGGLTPRPGYRILFREASEAATKAEIYQEVEEIARNFDDVLRKAESGIGPRRLYSSGSLLERVLKDYHGKLDMIHVDADSLKVQLKEEHGLPALLHRDIRGLFDFHGLEGEIQRLGAKRVQLPSGGNLVIEETEALVVIDVNSARHKGSTDKEALALSTNQEALREALRQIRLRNLSGILILDLIDMQVPKNRQRMYDIVKEEAVKDSQIARWYPLTELNLLQITRKKRGEPLSKWLQTSCGGCGGSGKVPAFPYVVQLLRNELARKGSGVDIEDFALRLHPRYGAAVDADPAGFLKDIEAEGKRIYLRYEEGAPYQVEALVFGSQIRTWMPHLLGDSKALPPEVQNPEA